MRQRVLSWLKRVRSDMPNILFALVLFVVNLALFASEYFHYCDAVEFYYLRVLTGGHFLALARASALCLKANSAFVLIPICRNCLSLLRSVFAHCPEPAGRSTRRLLDNNVIHHKWVGRTIFFFSLLHILAHCFNLEHLCQAFDSDDQVILAISRYPDNFQVDETPSSSSSSTSCASNFVNPIRLSSTSPFSVLFSTWTGLTGVIATVALVLIWTSASRIVRIYAYELFWFTHRLFVVYYIVLGVHGVGGFVRHQTNIDDHDPRHCIDHISEWGKRPDCPLPRFAPSPPSAWKWIVGPLALYLIERVVKVLRTRHPYRITAIIFHPSNVLELRMRPSVGQRIRVEPGQYISLQCPTLSKLEWHPFTLTSAPDDEDISVHIRGVGDWTKGLAKLCQKSDDDTSLPSSSEQDRKNLPTKSHVLQRSPQHPAHQRSRQSLQNPPPQNQSDQPPRPRPNPIPVDISAAPIIYVDGPFGAASEEWFSYETAVFVGAGIGVTPFASVLKHVANRRLAGLNQHHSYVKKIHFFWVTPEIKAFEWFRDLLHELETSTRRFAGRTAAASPTGETSTSAAAPASHSTASSLPPPAASPFTIYSPDSTVASAASSVASAAEGDDKLLSYHIFLTRGWDPKDAGEIAARDRAATYDAFSNLRHRTEFGRPNWKAELNKIVDSIPGGGGGAGARVGVFLCGPKPLAQELKKACQNVNEQTDTGTRLYFNKEHF